MVLSKAGACQEPKFLNRLLDCDCDNQGCLFQLTILFNTLARWCVCARVCGECRHLTAVCKDEQGKTKELAVDEQAFNWTNCENLFLIPNDCLRQFYSGLTATLKKKNRANTDLEFGVIASGTLRLKKATATKAVPA